MKVLVTGAKGQLGNQIIDIMKHGKSELGIIDSAYKDAVIVGIGKEDLDISKLEDVQALIGEFKPDIIINCAAYTNVDGCEENEELAFSVNTIGVKNLAIAAKKVDAKLLHISTDYVFEGNGNVPYREYDLTSPVSVYGKTKLAGEKFVKEFCDRHFIVRTSWLYGYNGKNFVKTIMKAAKEKTHLEVVEDQRGNPTNAEDFAHHILKIALSEEYGIYHCTGNSECSWYDFACKIVEYANMDCIVKPTTSDKLLRRAKRPAFSSLDNMMLRSTVGDEMREWQLALKMFIEKVENI